MASRRNNYYLTFGLKYRDGNHPFWTGADGKGWVRIEAYDEEVARNIARQFFGFRWAFIYREEDFNTGEDRRFYPKGQLLNIIQSTSQIRRNRGPGIAVDPTGEFTTPTEGDL